MGRDCCQSAGIVVCEQGLLSVGRDCWWTGTVVVCGQGFLKGFSTSQLHTRCVSGTDHLRQLYALPH